MFSEAEGKDIKNDTHGMKPKSQHFPRGRMFSNYPDNGIWVLEEVALLFLPFPIPWVMLRKGSASYPGLGLAHRSQSEILNASV